MARIGLFSHAPSNTVIRLRDALTIAGIRRVVKIRQEGSTFRGLSDDLIFNYGSSTMPSNVAGQAPILNQPSAVGRASSKLQAFRAMSQAGVRTVEFTNLRGVAQEWADEGALVYVRRRLQGHSGEGIELVSSTSAAVEAGGFPIHRSVPEAPLYTKAIIGNRREYRIHVFDGKILHIAQKRRRDGFAEIEGHNSLVRNHHTGWIYSTQNMTELNIAGKNEALKAVAALGLDFGAVDIITNRDDAWVLEVNTAPGMEGVTLDKYVAAIMAKFNGREVEGETIANFETYRQQVTENAVNTTSQRTRNVAATQPSPATETQRSAPAAQPQTRAETAPTAQRRPTSGSSLTDSECYWLTVAGEQTIGKYNSSLNSFEILGWEVPVEAQEATVVAHIDNPNRS